MSTSLVPCMYGVGDSECQFLESHRGWKIRQKVQFRDKSHYLTWDLCYLINFSVPWVTSRESSIAVLPPRMENSVVFIHEQWVLKYLKQNFTKLKFHRHSLMCTGYRIVLFPHKKTRKTKKNVERGNFPQNTICDIIFSFGHVWFFLYGTSHAGLADFSFEQSVIENVIDVVGCHHQR